MRAKDDDGLIRSTRTLLHLLPPWVARSGSVAVVASGVLGLLELLALVLLFPVFTVLAGGAGAATGSFSWAPAGWDASMAQWAAIAALVLMMLRSLLSLWVRNWWLGRTADAEIELSESVLRRYAFAPYSFHLTTHSAELMTRVVAHVNLACTAGLTGIVNGLSEALVVLGLAAGLIVVDPGVGLVVVAYVGVLATCYALATRRLVNRATRRFADHTATVYKNVNVMLQGMREITVLGAREEYVRLVGRNREVMVNSQRVLGIAREIPKAALEVALYASVLVVLGVLFSRGTLTESLPLLALYVLAGTRIVPAIARMLASFSQARSGLSVAADLSGELAELSELDAAQPLPAVGRQYPQRASLTLDRVSFAYPDTTDPVLRDVSLDIPFGTFVGVVGASGSGKSTLTSLLLGLLSPTSGTIRSGGTAVHAGDPAWYDRVAVVAQEVFLTDRSLRENLLAADASDNEIMEALRRAGLPELVAELPDGLDTRLGEGGGRLSAGQRQRVGVARALLRRAEVLILDEPTSALDRDSEALVMDALHQLAGECTIVAVAHRVETLRRADLVIRLDSGRISRQGSPDAVLGPAVDLRAPAR